MKLGQREYYVGSKVMQMDNNYEKNVFNGEIGYTLPAFCFDGEVSPQITVGEHSLTVSYEGWVCRYTTNGKIEDLKKIAANRNGHYRVFLATAQNALKVKIEIEKA